MVSSSAVTLIVILLLFFNCSLPVISYLAFASSGVASISKALTSLSIFILYSLTSGLKLRLYPLIVNDDSLLFDDNLGPLSVSSRFILYSNLVISSSAVTITYMGFLELIFSLFLILTVAVADSGIASTIISLTFLSTDIVYYNVSLLNCISPGVNFKNCK